LADGFGLVSGGLVGGVEFEIHADIIADKRGGCSSSRAKRGDPPFVRHRERSVAICLLSINSSSRACEVMPRGHFVSL